MFSVATSIKVSNDCLGAKEHAPSAVRITKRTAIAAKAEVNSVLNRIFYAGVLFIFLLPCFRNQNYCRQVQKMIKIATVMEFMGTNGHLSIYSYRFLPFIMNQYTQSVVLTTVLSLLTDTCQFIGYFFPKTMTIFTVSPNKSLHGYFL